MLFQFKGKVCKHLTTSKNRIMKRILLIAIASLFSMATMAATNIAKPLPVVKTNPVSPEVKEKKVINVPADAKVVKKEVDGWICVLIIYSDGSWIEICCTNCIIIIVFE